jgi:hypothetical protein
MHIGFDGARLVRRGWPLLVFAVAACGGPPPQAPVPEGEIARAEAALQPFKGQLFEDLTRALADGPAEAVAFCRLQAPAIAAAQSTGGVQVGRTSHRLRNPANAPAPWMEPLLAAYGSAPAGAQPRAVRLEDGRVGYVEPIYVRPLCLACHGTDVPAAVQAKLQEAYPEDQATGFAEGDFRGLFWVTLPADTAVAGG